MKMMLAMAVALANIAILDRNSIPKDGTVIWSTKIGEYRRFYYDLEVRVFADHTYGVAWHHVSGHLSISDERYHFLEAAIAEAFQSRRDYYQTEAEERADAVEWYYREMANAI